MSPLGPERVDQLVIPAAPRQQPAVQLGAPAHRLQRVRLVPVGRSRPARLDIVGVPAVLEIDHRQPGRARRRQHLGALLDHPGGALDVEAGEVEIAARRGIGVLHVDHDHRRIGGAHPNRFGRAGSVTGAHRRSRSCRRSARSFISPRRCEHRARNPQARSVGRNGGIFGRALHPQIERATTVPLPIDDRQSGQSKAACAAISGQAARSRRRWPRTPGDDQCMLEPAMPERNMLEPEPQRRDGETPLSRSRSIRAACRTARTESRARRPLREARAHTIR